MTPELAALLAIAREVAWSSWSNLYGLPYYQRRDAVKRLRGALLTFDGQQGEAQPTRNGAEPRRPKVAA